MEKGGWWEREEVLVVTALPSECYSVDNITVFFFLLQHHCFLSGLMWFHFFLF